MAAPDIKPLEKVAVGTRRRGLTEQRRSPAKAWTLPSRTRRKGDKGRRWGLLPSLAICAFLLVYVLVIVGKIGNYFGISDSRSIRARKHKHAIPNILIFTHRYNLLTENIHDLTHIDSELRTELIALQNNVHNAIALHPGASVRFLTDDDCVQSIRNVMGNNSSLVNYFRAESEGMFKADLCRGAALAETGGLYFDVDLGVRMSLWDVLKPSTMFATVKVHLQSNHLGAFFQAFMGASPNHRVIVRYVELFRDYYEGKFGKIDGPLGVILLKRAYDEILHEEGERKRLAKLDKAENIVVDAPSLQDTTELWQEVLYIPEFRNTLLRNVPPPTWGTRRACKFIVLTGSQVPVVAPFYSRIEGSRMCPASTSNFTSDKLKSS